jgi:hypothetical protein
MTRPYICSKPCKCGVGAGACRERQDVERELIIIKTGTMKTKKNANKYVDLWKDELPDIIEMLQKAEKGTQQKTLSKAAFDELGHRKKYGFNLEFKNGEICNNIRGSAVARDLKIVLSESLKAKKILQTGHYKINMGIAYCLTITKL